MVRTTVGTIAEAELSVRQSETVVTVDASETASIPAGGGQSTIIKAPSGTTLSVLGLRIRVDPPSGATSGDHQITLAGPTNIVRYLKAESNFDDPIIINDSIIFLATSVSRPSTEAAQSNSIQSLIADDEFGITIAYSNGTDAEQTQERQIDIVAIQQGVST